jgi:hypothetical protein
MREDRMSAHRFRWLAGMLAAVIGLLLWQNWQLRTELRRLHNRVEEAVATAKDTSEYARQAKEEAVFARDGADFMDSQNALPHS